MVLNSLEILGRHVGLGKLLCLPIPHADLLANGYQMNHLKLTVIHKANLPYEDQDL